MSVILEYIKRVLGRIVGRILKGCIKRSMASRSKDVVLRRISACIRPHLDYRMKFWCPQHKDIELWEQVQRRARGFDKRTRAFLPWRQAKRFEVTEPIEEKGAWRTYSNIPLSEEGLQRSQSGTLHHKLQW